MGTRATSDELGFNKPGALTRYFARRWLNRRGTKDEQQLIAWLLEAALGRNALYFIEKTKEYLDEWGGRGEIVPASAFDGFVLTGDPFEDTIIPHAVLVWTCMNDRPWPEEVYHRWLDQLLAAGSPEAAYLAASLWPAHDLMAKVRYRPAGWLVYRGQLDAEAERLILVEMLKGASGPRTSLYGSFEYDDVPYPEKLPEQYIKRHGFTHPICGLVDPLELEWNSDLHKRIQEALAAPSWSEGVKDAVMLLYLSLKAFNKLRMIMPGMLDILEQNLSKLDEKNINIINFHMSKIEQIDYNLIKDYINYLIVLYNNIINKNCFYLIKDKNCLYTRDAIFMEIFSKYISIGLKTKDILYIGKNLRYIIIKLMLKEKEEVQSWMENQADDLRIKDISFFTYISKIGYYNYIVINEKLTSEQLDKKIEDIYGKIKYFDKIKLLIDLAKIYFYENNCIYTISYFLDDILKREKMINFNYNFKEDYAKIIHSWYPKRNFFSIKDIFFKFNHIGLYLYYGILSNFEDIVSYRICHSKAKKEVNTYLCIRDKIIKNLYTGTMNSIEKMDLYLNKIESNNMPYEEIKYKLIIESINIMKSNYNKILEYFKDENKLITARKVILSNIKSIEEKLIDSGLIELLGIDNKSQNMIIY